MVFTPFGDLDGATEPTWIWHPSSLRVLYILVIKVKLKPNFLMLLPDSHSFAQIALFGILLQPAKWGWVSFLGTSVSEDHWFPSVLMKCLWPDQMLLGARSPPSSRTGLCFPISPLGWRDCRCLFCWWPILTMIYLWALVPGLTMALVQPPVWYC